MYKGRKVYQDDINVQKIKLESIPTIESKDHVAIPISQQAIGIEVLLE